MQVRLFVFPNGRDRGMSPFMPRRLAHRHPDTNFFRAFTKHTKSQALTHSGLGLLYMGPSVLCPSNLQCCLNREDMFWSAALTHYRTSFQYTFVFFCHSSMQAMIKLNFFFSGFIVPHCRHHVSRSYDVCQCSLPKSTFSTRCGYEDCCKLTVLVVGLRRATAALGHGSAVRRVWLFLSRLARTLAVARAKWMLRIVFVASVPRRSKQLMIQNLKSRKWFFICGGKKEFQQLVPLIKEINRTCSRFQLHKLSFWNQKNSQK